MTSLTSAVVWAAEISPERLTEVCGEQPGAACRWVLEKTDVKALAIVADVFMRRMLIVVLIWLIAIALNRATRLLIKRVGKSIEGAARSGGIEKMRDRTPSMLLNTGAVGMRSAARANTTTQVLRSVSSFVIYSMATLYSMSALGLQVGPLVAGAGIAGVALGFGAQSMVRDFLGGIFLLIEDQFGVGDVIDVASTVNGSPGTVGTVEAVTLRVTSVRDVYGTIWHIPNGQIRRVGNTSQGWARALLDISVPYGVDLEEASETIRQVAAEVCHSREFGPEILGEPEVWGVQDLGPDAVVIRLVIKTRPGEQWRIMRALRSRLHNALHEAGVGHPFAQHTVWLRDATLPSPDETSAELTTPESTPPEPTRPIKWPPTGEWTPTGEWAPTGEWTPTGE